MLHTLRFFSLQNAVYFIMLPFMVPVLFTLYIQVVLKFKKKKSGAKGLNKHLRCGMTQNTDGSCVFRRTVSPLLLHHHHRKTSKFPFPLYEILAQSSLC